MLRVGSSRFRSEGSAGSRSASEVRDQCLRVSLTAAATCVWPVTAARTAAPLDKPRDTSSGDQAAWPASVPTSARSACGPAASHNSLGSMPPGSTATDARNPAAAAIPAARSPAT